MKSVSGGHPLRTRVSQALLLILLYYYKSVLRFSFRYSYFQHHFVFCFLTHNFYAFFMFWLDLSINIHEYLFSYPLDRKSVKEHGLMSGSFRDIHSHRRNAIKNTKTINKSKYCLSVYFREYSQNIARPDQNFR